MSASPATVVRQAIETRLKGDATLAELLATSKSVYHRFAPQQARVPLALYFRVSSSRTYTFNPNVYMYNEVWTIKGIAFSRTADRAEAIGARIETLFNGVDLVIPGRACLDVRLQSDIDYPEQVGKETLQHIGGDYRIISEDT